VRRSWKSATPSLVVPGGANPREGDPAVRAKQGDEVARLQGAAALHEPIA
jgi:hypothetical protein